ncbi:MAG: trehalose-6-phosphate synthase, partial [Acidimicrobiia bacterium]|nr:trehalose-6-phosphate synthase [Acidimicrobiia bacterium]
MDRRVIVVANRLPVKWDAAGARWETSPGGLVSALTPILQASEGSWVGWSGVSDSEFAPFEHEGIEQVPIHLSEDQYREFYVGFCNGTLWPLYHDAIRPPEFHRHTWRPYVDVNRIFAERTAEVASDDDIVWVQDYQLQLVPRMLREAEVGHRIGFYLHIPFPPVELFSTLPWRSQVLNGLLGSDVIAFQSRSSRSNFARAARRLVGAEGSSSRLEYQGRTIELQVSPIGIDAEAFAALGRDPSIVERAAQIRSDLGDPEVVILGVDRLDYTKGIDFRIKALETLLERRPELVGKVALVQVAVPSREDVEQYRIIREDIERLVGRVNGSFGEVGRPPIHYLHRSLPIKELAAYYRAADVMLVTPLRDGMNLVAKEYVAIHHRPPGVLVLSEFAGAAEQFGAALLVNPYDTDGLTSMLEWSTRIDAEERSRRMRRLWRSVRDH